MTPKELSIEAGQTLCAARKLAKLSAAKLIEASGDKTLTRPLVSQYERGAVLIGFERLEKLLETCGAVPSDELRRKYVSLANESHQYAQNVVRTPAEIANQEKWSKFVRLWQTANCVDDVTKAMGITKATAHNWAGIARRHGIALRRFKNSNASLDWDALKQIADEA